MATANLPSGGTGFRERLATLAGEAARKIGRVETELLDSLYPWNRHRATLVDVQYQSETPDTIGPVQYRCLDHSWTDSESAYGAVTVSLAPYVVGRVIREQIGLGTAREVRETYVVRLGQCPDCGKIYYRID